MITLNSPTLLFWFSFIYLMIGVLIFAFGNRLPARGVWLLWVGVLLALLGVGLESGLFLREEFHSKVWSSGWILPKTDANALTVGVFQDLFGLVLFLIAALVAAGLLLNTSVFKHAHSERSLGALAISMAGMGVVSLALTPWLLFVGLALTVVGGGLSFAAFWENDAEAKVTARFFWENSFGLLLTFFGACVLVTGQLNLFLNETSVWKEESSFTGALGLALVFAGFFLQAHLFPVLGWVVAESKQSPTQRILLNQLFPSWALFVLLIRLEHQFRALGLFPGLGWLAACAALLAFLSGLFQRNWRIALGLWTVGGLSLALTILAFTGRTPAFAFLLGMSLSALAQGNLGSALEEKPTTSNAVARTRAFWLKGLSFTAAASGTGFIGFLTLSGSLPWVAKAIDSPVQVTFFLFLLFFFGLLGWCIAWRISKLTSASNSSWMVILSSVLWLILSLAVLWTGTCTGGAVFGSIDRVLPSLLEGVFGAPGMDFKDSPESWSASSFYWGVLLISLLTAYWTSGRKEDKWTRIAQVFPRVSSFVAQGFQMDLFYKKFVQTLAWVGRSASRVIDGRIWSEWVPAGITYFLERVSSLFRGVDAAISDGIGTSVRKVIEVPGKALQLVQTGDLRLYLFFVISSGFALLAHYIKL
ncbi:MAG: hypothetical protein HYX41_01360 [Bdellovibrio sp.]|nr:hypothetical protein [Bdellovibrio sp.]